jgi:hypothetical protein
VQTVQSAPSAARLRGIGAASAHDVRGHTSHDPPVVGSSSTSPTSRFDTRARRAVDRVVYRCRRVRIRPSGASGHIEQLLDGCWRAKICAGDPGTGREIRPRKTCGTERAAQIERGQPGRGTSSACPAKEMFLRLAAFAWRPPFGPRQDHVTRAAPSGLFAGRLGAVRAGWSPGNGPRSRSRGMTVVS